MNREELTHILAQDRKHEVVLAVLYTRLLVVMTLRADMLRSDAQICSELTAN